MLFNSYSFASFFVAVFLLYIATSRWLRAQNTLLLVASYIFYAYWDWRFLSLILFSTMVDYTVGLRIEAATEFRSRRRWLLASLVSNLGLLGLFKYFNFFTGSAREFAALFGVDLGDVSVKIVLPVGISFYTFQTLSYTIDVYRGTLRARRHFLDFALFVSFFPQLVAGPIERATTLLPQIENPRKITADACNTGIALVVWGLFKKVVIADNMGLVANPIFDGYRSASGFELLVGALAFTVQIYGDFSGYSDIARGIAKLLGFELMLNFKLPYFSRTPSEFWRRWHVSLSSWLRDYLYIPLGGNRTSEYATLNNLLLTMILGGLWHGAAWNFVIWGVYHGIILVLYRLIHLATGGFYPAHIVGRYTLDSLRCAMMFVLTVVGWVIFRAETTEQIVRFIVEIPSLTWPSELEPFSAPYKLLFFSLPLILVQLLQLALDDLNALTRLPVWIRGPLFAVLVVGIMVFGVRDSSEFIYFQF